MSQPGRWVRLDPAGGGRVRGAGSAGGSSGQPNPEAGSWGRPDPRPAPSARHLQEGLEPPLRARRPFPPSRSSHACRPGPRSTADPDPSPPPRSLSAPPGSAARGGAAARIGRVAPTETPGGGWDGGERAPAEDAVGSQLGRCPRSRVGAVHAAGGGKCVPPTPSAHPARRARVPAEGGGGPGERRVGVARGRRPGTLIVTGWRAVLSHRDPRGGGGGRARPWRGECAAPGRGPGPGPAGSPGGRAAPPSGGEAAGAGTGYRAAAAQPPAQCQARAPAVCSRVTVAHLLGPLEHFIPPR